MPREPWKRAAQLSRMRSNSGRSARVNPGRGRSFNWGMSCAVLVLLVLAGAAAYLWLSRNQWLPRYRDKLPVVITDNLREERVYPDFIALEQGMGAGLVVFGSYLDLISGTREWRSDWSVVQTGPDTQRLENSGLRVYVKGGEIETFHIDLEELMADEQWSGWHPAWQRAQLTPDLTWTAYSGEQEMPGGLREATIVSQTAVRRGASWVRPAWVLQFHNGWLRRIEARIKFGAASGEDG